MIQELLAAEGVEGDGFMQWAKLRLMVSIKERYTNERCFSCILPPAKHTM